MTIGVGFLCSDGVVICADRQITGEGYKFGQRKIFYAHTKSWRVIFTYAGEVNAGQIMHIKVREGLMEWIPKIRENPTTDMVRNVLEGIYSSNHSEGLDTLVGFSIDHHPPFLFRTSGTKVKGALAEWIGCGDSSALRYLTEFLLPGQMSVDEAVVIGSYIISVANRYIEGCSGGPDRTTLYASGQIIEGTGGVFDHQEARFSHCENEIGKELRKLLLSGGRNTTTD